MKTHKNILICLLLLANLWGCSNKPSSTGATEASKEQTEGTTQESRKIPFKLSLQNAQPEEYLYLYEYNGTQQAVMDSFKVDIDGNFEKTYEVAYPSFYTLGLYDKRSAISFVLNDSPVTINADANAAAEASIEGGKDNALMKEFQQLNTELMEESQQLRQKGSTASTAEAQVAFQQEYKAFVDKAKVRIFKFVDENPKSIVTMQAMNMLSPDEDYEKMKEVSENLYAAYPNAPAIQSYHQKITDLGRLAVGNEAPDFALKTAEGEEIKLSSLRGQYVMIDFWASWCGPCRKENPHVKEVYADFHDKGFQILGVSVDQDHSAWKQAIAKDELPWLQVIDAAKEVGRTYNVSSIPFTLLLDKEGVIIAKGLRSQALRQKLEELF